MSGNIDFSRLDQLFQNATERLNTNGPFRNTPYEQGPLAEDHFMLNKSWDYFKKRIETIEDHYQVVLNSREEEKKLLEAALGKMKEELEAVVRKNQQLMAYEEAVGESRASDFLDFKKINEKLRLAWEIERLRLHEQSIKLENQIAIEKDNKISIEQAFRNKEKILRGQIDELKLALLTEEENALIKIKKSEELVLEKDETIAARERKIDLMAQEIERKSNAIGDLSKELHLRDKKIDVLTEKIDELGEEVHRQNEHVKNLETHIEMIKHDRSVIKENWKKEQASWRELWDRSQQIRPPRGA